MLPENPSVQTFESTYLCPCGAEGKIHETSTWIMEGYKCSIERTISFDHQAQPTQACVDFVEAYKAEQQSLLNRNISHAFETLERIHEPINLPEWSKEITAKMKEQS